MTSTPAPDAAVQIVDQVLDENLHEPDLPRDAVDALARAGWLHDPAEVERLRAVAARAEVLSRIETSGWGVDKITLHWIGRWLKYGDDNAALDTAPTTASTMYPRVRYGHNAPPSVEALDAAPGWTTTEGEK